MNNCHICGCEVIDNKTGHRFGDDKWVHHDGVECDIALGQKIATLEKLMIKTLGVLARGDINDVDISWAKEQINAKL